MMRWTHELGLPTLDTASVSEAERQARAGARGWQYHAGTDGLQVGHFVDWDPDVLGSPDDRHVSVVAELDRFGRVKSIGAGGPTGQVAFQPRNGGFNPRDYFRGYFVAPATTVQPAPSNSPAAPAAPKTDQGSGSGTYTVRPGDMLGRIARAHHTTVQAVMRANPPAANGRPADFHVTRADLIIVGQKLHLPS